MASAQEVERLRRQLDELTAQMIEIRQQSSRTAMNATVTRLKEAVRKMGQSVSSVGKREPYAPGKDFDDWDFTFKGYAGTLDPAYPAFAENSETITNSGDGDSTTRTAVCNLAVPSHDAHTERSPESRFEAHRQLRLMYGTSDPEGSTGLFVQIMTHKFGSKIEDMEDRLNEFLELVRRYDEANGTDPVPDQVKKACTISNTPEPLKTLVQLNVAKLANFNALRVATEGNTNDEDSMEVDAVSQKEKGKEKSGKGKKGGKNGEESHSGMLRRNDNRALAIRG